jgi:hypothetical protein
MKYTTYGCRAQGEKLPWQFSAVVQSETRKGATLDRNRLLMSESGEKPWTLAITVKPDGLLLMQTIPCAVA